MWAGYAPAWITFHPAPRNLSANIALPVFLMAMEHPRTLLTLYAINFLNSIGMWFFLPLLPIFLGRKGGSAALVASSSRPGCHG
jgi:hypothetical protein